jgi:NADH-quinone oxidoreductase subunit A
MLQPYIPILLLIAFVVANAILMLGASHLLSTYRRTATKIAPYESGMPVLGDARERFSVKFYLIAMIFILFDIEVIFLVPWAVVFKTLASPAFGLRTLIYVEMMVFVALLLAGYVYVIKKGAFEWNESARREAEGEARLLEDMEQRKRQQTRTAA